jgi:PAP2 superfamily
LLAIGCFAESAQTKLTAADTSFHVYNFNRWISGGIIGVGLVSDAIMVPKILGKKALTDAELDGLNKDVYINKIDHWALTLDPSQRTKFKNYSDYLSVGIYASAGLLMVDSRVRNDWLDIILLCLETHSVAFSAYNLSFLGPTFQNRYRPVVYYSTELTKDQRRSGNNRNSFYSGHVASSTTGTFFMATIYSDYHPELGLKKYLLYGAAAVPPLVLGYLRVKSLDHFPSDVGAGFIIGAVCGVMVPEMHRNANKKVSVESYNTPDGANGLSLKWEP